VDVEEHAVLNTDGVEQEMITAGRDAKKDRAMTRLLVLPPLVLLVNAALNTDIAELETTIAEQAARAAHAILVLPPQPPALPQPLALPQLPARILQARGQLAAQ